MDGTLLQQDRLLARMGRSDYDLNFGGHLKEAWIFTTSQSSAKVAGSLSYYDDFLIFGRGVAAEQQKRL